jgi:hypothetical protein
LVVCALAAAASPLVAQGRAPARIFLAPFTEGPDKNTRVAFVVVSRVGVQVGKPIVKVTSHQRDDDEPWFLPDSSGFLFTSDRDGKQSDVFRYDLASKAVTQVTHTPEDERAPVAASDGKSFTVTRGPERRVWRFNLDGSDAGAVSSHPGSVVGHAWLSDTTVAVTTSAGTLVLVDAATGAAETLESGVGRSLFVTPDRLGIVFTRTVQDGSRVIRVWRASTRTARETAFALEGAEHHAATPQGRAVMARRSKLYFLDALDDRWVEFADLDKSGIKDITHVAVSPDGKWIAIAAR